MDQRFHDRCKENDLKITPQRIMIYDIVADCLDHPSAEDIYQEVKKKLPNISYDTVYRTLMTFSEIGLLDTVEGYGEPKRYDPNMKIHHHFRCMKCRRIVDIYSEELDSIKVPDHIRKQYKVESTRIILKGICDQCQV